MSRQRRSKPRKHQKKSDIARTCPSGKRGWRKQGEADAFHRKRPNPELVSYECKECGEWHLGNKVPRRVRRHLAEAGKPSPPAPPNRKEP